MPELKVLFLCTANSCRSQMAEGIVNHDFAGRITAYSAGTQVSYVNPRAIDVLREIGIDISAHRSKHLDEFADDSFDHVITLCGDANERCPLLFGGRERVHLGFSDPAKATGSDDEIMNEFRRVRDELRETLIRYFTSAVSQ